MCDADEAGPGKRTRNEVRGDAAPSDDSDRRRRAKTLSTLPRRVLPSLLSLTDVLDAPLTCEKAAVQLRVLELFSGLGGMRLGLQNALSRVSTATCSCPSPHFTAVDVSPLPNRVYEHNFKNHHVCPNLVEHIRPPDVDGRFHLWLMSPPCQPYTTTTSALQLDEADQRSCGLSAVLALLESLQSPPKWLFLENVKGFLPSKMCEVTLRRLCVLGYSYRLHLVSPIDLGLPNCRSRLYMVAERSTRFHTTDDSGKSAPGCLVFGCRQKGRAHFPEDGAKYLEAINGGHPTAPGHPLSPQPPLLDDSGDASDVQLSCRTLNEVVGSVPLTPTELTALFVAGDFLRKPATARLSIVGPGDRITRCFTGGYGKLIHASAGSMFFDESAARTQKRLAAAGRAPMGESEDRHDDDATVARSAALHVGRSLAREPLDRHDMLQYEGRIRFFAPQELLRLFGFPDTYTFPDGTPFREAFRLIGNSVNVTVVSHVLAALLC